MKSSEEQRERETFAKCERLLRPIDFLKVRRGGRRYSSKGLRVFILPSELGTRRLGLAVSTQVGGAVRRNKIKRLVREFFRLNKSKFPASTDILVTAKKGATFKTRADVAAEFEQILGSMP